MAGKLQVAFLFASTAIPMTGLLGAASRAAGFHLQVFASGLAGKQCANCAWGGQWRGGNGMRTASKLKKIATFNGCLCKSIVVLWGALKATKGFSKAASKHAQGSKKEKSLAPVVSARASSQPVERPQACISPRQDVLTEDLISRDWFPILFNHRSYKNQPFARGSGSFLEGSIPGKNGNGR